jgi:hypothetical protein
MTWRQRLGRVARPVVLAVARALRGESQEQRRATTVPPASHARHLSVAAVAAVEKTSSLPPWGLRPSQIPPRVELLRGRSSIKLLRRSRSLVGRVLVVYAIVVTLAFLTWENHGAVALTAMVALFVGGAIYGAIGEPSIERARLERDAGYTVWRRGTRWKPQVDAETGFVIRPAGAPELTKKQEAVALKRVREIARYLDDR